MLVAAVQVAIEHRQDPEVLRSRSSLLRGDDVSQVSDGDANTPDLEKMRTHDQAIEPLFEGTREEGEIELAETADEVPHIGLPERHPVMAECQTLGAVLSSDPSVEFIECSREPLKVLRINSRREIDVAGGWDRRLLRDGSERSNDNELDIVANEDFDDGRRVEFSCHDVVGSGIGLGTASRQTCCWRSLAARSSGVLASSI